MDNWYSFHFSPVIRVHNIFKIFIKSSGSLCLEERRLRVFENRVLRKIFQSKREKVTEDWRHSYGDELHNL
jgi:hypothetical protein